MIIRFPRFLQHSPLTLRNYGTSAFNWGSLVPSSSKRLGYQARLNSLAPSELASSSFFAMHRPLSLEAPPPPLAHTSSPSPRQVKRRSIANARNLPIRVVLADPSSLGEIITRILEEKDFSGSQEPHILVVEADEEVPRRWEPRNQNNMSVMDLLRATQKVMELLSNPILQAKLTKRESRILNHYLNHSLPAWEALLMQQPSDTSLFTLLVPGPGIYSATGKRHLSPVKTKPVAWKLTSVLRKRRLKMNKHKYRKLRRRTKALRKKLNK